MTLFFVTLLCAETSLRLNLRLVEVGRLNGWSQPESIRGLSVQVLISLESTRVEVDTCIIRRASHCPSARQTGASNAGDWTAGPLRHCFIFGLRTRSTKRDKYCAAANQKAGIRSGPLGTASDIGASILPSRPG